MDASVLRTGPGATTSVTEEALAPLGLRCEILGPASVSEALPRAKGEFLVTVEDGSRLDVELFDKMWHRKDDAEVVLASRFVRGAASRPGLLSIQLHRLLQRVLRLPCHDVTSGVRLYKTSALRRVLRDETDLSPLELLVTLHNHGFRIREVPAGVRGKWPGLASIARTSRLRRAPDAADSDDIGFESRLPWKRRRLQHRQQTIVSYLEVDVPVLDVGCGSGRLIQALAKGVGVDRDRRKLRFLRGRARATVAGDLVRLPFRDASFPQVVFSNVLQELAPGTEYLPELRRILRARGTLVLATPLGRTSEASLRGELERNGFAIDEVRRGPRREVFFRAIRKEAPEA
jgi:SAM-dependent methyltransferase